MILIWSTNMSSFEDLPGNERVCHSTIHSTAPLFNVSIVWFHSSIVWFHCNFHSSMSGSSSPHHINTMFDMQNAQVAWFIITAWFRDPSSKLNLGICRDKIKIQATSMKHVVDPNGMSITLIKTAQRYRKDEVLKKLIGEDAFKSRSQQATGNIPVLAYNQCGGGEIIGSNGVGILVNLGDTKDKFQETEEFIKRAEQGLEPSWKYLGKSPQSAPSETEQPAKKTTRLENDDPYRDFTFRMLDVGSKKDNEMQQKLECMLKEKDKELKLLHEERKVEMKSFLEDRTSLESA